jgi:hypothetical protein
MPFKKTTSKKTATDDKKGKKTDASDKSAKKKGGKKPLPFFLKKKFEDKSKKAKVEKKPVAKKKKKSVVKESFDGFIKHLLKESFGLLKKKVVEEKNKDADIETSDLSLVENPKINKKDRIKITNHIHGSKMLGGNLKVDSISKGLHEVGNILDSCGYNLEMVTGDMIMGEKGSILLKFSRKTDNPFIEGVEIENSRISFSWENIESPDKDGFQSKKKYEILAYLT